MARQTPFGPTLRAQIDRISGSRAFADRQRVVPLLAHLVALVEARAADSAFSEASLALDYFAKTPSTWGPDDSTVRVYMLDLRNGLTNYYATEAHAAEIEIKLVKGSYRPRIGSTSRLGEDLDYEGRALVLRVKTLLDVRTFAADQEASALLSQLEDGYSEHKGVIQALRAYASAVATQHTTYGVGVILGCVWVAIMRSERDVLPWECTLVEACAKAAVEHDWEEAQRLFDDAVSSSLGEAAWLWWYPAMLASRGRLVDAIRLLDDAVAHFARQHVAMRLDLATLLCMSGDCRSAEKMLLGILDFAPDLETLVRIHLALVYEAEGKSREAYELLFQDLEAVMSDDPRTHTNLTYSTVIYVAGIAGDRANACAGYKTLQKKPFSLLVPPFQVAIAALGAGEPDEAVGWLRTAAMQANAPQSMLYHMVPQLRHLKGHVGYQRLLEELRLEVPR